MPTSEGDMDEVLGANSIRNITMKVVGGATDEAVAAIAKLPNVSDPSIVGTSIKFGFRGGDEEQMQLLNEITGLGIKVYSFNEDEALESIYLNMIKESR